MNDRIAGALFDFLGFLTTQEKCVSLGASELATPAVDLLTEWAKTRGLGLDDADVSGWHSALQPAGQGEAVAWLHILPNGKGVSFSPPDKHGPIKGIPLYTYPQPAVPNAPEVVFDMLKAAQGCCLLGLNDTADKYIQNAIDLLSAGKENNNE
jgi:hypothetical protein